MNGLNVFMNLEVVICSVVLDVGDLVVVFMD